MSHFVLSSAYRRFRGRDLLTLADYTAEEIQLLLDLAIQLKKRQKEGKPTPLLSGKTLGMIFEKSSTRTRVSFEVGMYQLGGQALFLSSHDLQLGRGETIADTARVLSRYVDGIMIRTFAHEKAVELARYATVPVINGLTDDFHPCQVLADLLTIFGEKRHVARGETGLRRRREQHGPLLDAGRGHHGHAGGGGDAARL